MTPFRILIAYLPEDADYIKVLIKDFEARGFSTLLRPYYNRISLQLCDAFIIVFSRTYSLNIIAEIAEQFGGYLKLEQRAVPPMFYLVLNENLMSELNLDRTREGVYTLSNPDELPSESFYQDLTKAIRSYREAHKPPAEEIFISYSNTDRETFVRPLVTKLRTEGLIVWFDETNIEGSQDWLDEINQGLENCEVLILFITPESLASKFVKIEYRYFINNNKPVLPILCKPTKLPAELMGVQHEKFEDTDKILKLIRKLLKTVHFPKDSDHGEEIALSQPDTKVVNLPIHNINLRLKTEYGVDTDQISVIQFTPDRRFIIGGLRRDSVALWEASSGKLKHTNKPKVSEKRSRSAHWKTKSVSVSPDSKLLASSTGVSKVQLWRVDGLELGETLDTNSENPSNVAFLPGGEWLIAGLGTSGRIVSWSMRDNFRKVDQIKGHENTITSLVPHPLNPSFVTGTVDGEVKYWGVINEEIKPLHTFEIYKHEQVESLAISPDGRNLVCGYASGDIGIWDIEARYSQEPLIEHTAIIRALEFSSDGELLISTSNDRTLKIWHTADYRKILSKKFPSPVCSVRFAPDGTLAVALESGNKIQIWEIE